MLGYVYYDPYRSVRETGQQSLEQQISDAILRLTGREGQVAPDWKNIYNTLFGENIEPGDRNWRRGAAQNLRNILFNAGLHDVLAGLTDDDVEDIATKFATSWQNTLEKNALVQPYEEGNRTSWTATPGMQQAISSLVGFLRQGGREISPDWLNEQFAAEHQGSRHDLTTPEGRARLVEWAARKVMGATNVGDDRQKAYAIDALETYIRNMIGGEIGRQLTNMIRNVRSTGGATRVYGALQKAYENALRGDYTGSELSPLVEMLRRLAGNR